MLKQEYYGKGVSVMEHCDLERLALAALSDPKATSSDQLIQRGIGYAILALAAAVKEARPEN